MINDDDYKVKIPKKEWKRPGGSKNYRQLSFGHRPHRPTKIFPSQRGAFCKEVINDGTYDKASEKYGMHKDTVAKTVKTHLFQVCVYLGMSLDRKDRNFHKVLKNKERWLKAIDQYEVQCQRGIRTTRERMILENID